MIKRVQRQFASSREGAIDLIKGIIACAFQNITFMLPASLLYFLIADMLGGGIPEGKGVFYTIGCMVCIGMIFLATWFQYNGTYLVTYIEKTKIT